MTAFLLTACGDVYAQKQPAPKQVTISTHEGTALSFDLTPDGRTIVFDLLGQLWSVAASGGNAVPLTDAVRDTTDDSDPSVSPDGHWVLFRSDRPSGRGLWLRSLVNGELKQLVAAEFSLNADPLSSCWSPDGRRIAYVVQLQVHVYDLTTGAESVLRPDGLPRFTNWVTWSREGTRLLTISAAGIPDHLWDVDLASNRAAPVPLTVSNPQTPAYSPDGLHIALFGDGGARRITRLYVAGVGDTEARILAESADMSTLRLRWSPDGRYLVYSADGKLWRVSADGGGPTSIPFAATLNIPLTPYRDPVVPVQRAGERLPARGFTGLAIAPDGRRYAMLALGKLWVATVGHPPRAIRPVPITAGGGVAWAPDGEDLVWSAGPGGAEDLFVTNLRDGHTRHLTALPGTESSPSWSPDGRWIAFAHWAQPGLPSGESGSDSLGWRIRVVDARRRTPAALTDTRDLGAFDEFLGGVPAWNGESSAVLAIRSSGWPMNHPQPTRAVWLGIGGAERPAGAVPYQPSFLHIGRDGSLTYVQDGLLWRAPPAGQPRLLSRSPALYPTVADDGTTLFASSRGLRLLHANGSEQLIGWPLSLQVLPAPPPLLIHNVRIFDVKGRPSPDAHDLLIERGRISRMASPGQIAPRGEVAELDARGRVAIPGLIDAHAHLPDVAVLPGNLYFGVTTVREVGGDLASVAALRDAVLAGILPGPRVVESGIMFYPGTATTGGWTGGADWMTRDSATLSRGLDLLQAFGAGHVKLRIPVTFAASATLVRLARARGLSVSGHCASPLTLVIAGVNGQEHLDGECNSNRGGAVAHDDRAQLYRAAGIWGVPTIYQFAPDRAARDGSGAYEAEPFLTPMLRFLLLNEETGPWMIHTAEKARLGTRWFHDSGLSIALGVDAPRRLDGIHGELEELVASGLTPSEALVAATSAAARMLGIDREVGSITVGKAADLVLLDADPLADIRNTRRIWRVVQGGRVVDRAWLRSVGHEDPDQIAATR